MDFERLTNQHRDAVYRQMVRVCGNQEDAEDVLIEALLRAYRGQCLGALDREEDARRDLEQAKSEAGLNMQVLRVVLDGYRLLGDSKRVEEIQKLMTE